MRALSPVFKKTLGAFILGSLAALSGCWYDSSSEQVAGTATSPPGTSASNVAPAISGVPGSSVMAGESYRFVPTVSDADGDKLTFSVDNLPAWANFSSVTGELYGTPQTSDVGSYAGVKVSVSDGKTSTSLATFVLTVLAAGASPIATGSALLSWQAPTLNEDGSALVGLAGYKIYYGNSLGAMNQVISLAGADNTRYNFTNLGAGTYFFGVVAVTAGGVESRLSGVASKTIG